jgi:hypothetical protein
MSILRSHQDYALADLKKVISIVGRRDVTNVRVQQDNYCLESYPCQGHGGVILEFIDGTSETYACGSVSIGAIMWYFGVQNDHFVGYINPEFRQFLTQNLNK